jgi:hypothetical protein
MADFKRIIIANGGYLKEPKVEVIELNETDEEFDDEFKNFEEYCKYMVEESRAEYEQSFASSIVLTEEQFKSLSTVTP